MTPETAPDSDDAESVHRAGTGDGETADDAESAPEATKRRFREALAAKHGQEGEDHIDTNPRQADPHPPMNDKRTFRRKTG